MTGPCGNPAEGHMKDEGRTGDSYMEIQAMERAEEQLMTGKTILQTNGGNLIKVHHRAKQETAVTSHNNSSAEADVTRSYSTSVFRGQGRKGDGECCKGKTQTLISVTEN